MKNKVKSLMREIRKQKENKNFIIAETGEKKWELEIKLPVIHYEKYCKVELNLGNLTELGFEIGIAQWDYENKVMYEGLKEQFIDKKGGGDAGNQRGSSVGSGNCGSKSSALERWFLCTGKRIKRILGQKGK
jgi:hypothetical protein